MPFSKPTQRPVLSPSAASSRRPKASRDPLAADCIHAKVVNHAEEWVPAGLRPPGRRRAGERLRRARSRACGLRACAYYVRMPNRSTKTQRKATNLSLDRALVAEAKDLELNAPRIAEDAITEAVRAEKNRRWKEENREALETWNAWVRENGLPLEKHRLF